MAAQESHTFGCDVLPARTEWRAADRVDQSRSVRRHPRLHLRGLAPAERGDDVLVARFRRRRWDHRGRRITGMADDCERESKWAPVPQCEGRANDRSFSDIRYGIRLQLDRESDCARWLAGHVDHAM